MPELLFSKHYSRRLSAGQSSLHVAPIPDAGVFSGSAVVVDDPERIAVEVSRVRFFDIALPDVPAADDFSE